MALNTIIIADETCPPNSLIPVFLEKLLGDPILFWQLKALPKITSKIFIIAGKNHGSVAPLLSELEQIIEFKAKIEILEGFSLADSILGLSKTIGSDTEAQVLLLKSTQPLINQAALEKLILSTGILVPEGQCDNLLPVVGPISIPFSALQSAAQALPTESGFEDLVKQITINTALERMYCDPDDLLEIYTRQNLIEMQDVAGSRIISRWLEAGIAFIDPWSTFVGPRVELNTRGVLIEPNVRLEGKVTLGEGSTIGQGSIVRNSSLGSCVEIRPYCIIEGCTIGDKVRIGPFAHLREGTHLDLGVHLGNFVETKKAHLHAGARANHLSYLGDCEVGEETNIGAGCITCNYDGFQKNKTVIGKNVFVGSDCQLVAPVTVGDGAVLGAGTTLTSDAPEGSLVLTRPETTIRNGGAKTMRDRLKTKSKPTK